MKSDAEIFAFAGDQFISWLEFREEERGQAHLAYLELFTAHGYIFRILARSRML
jgi:hypothetical protein